MNTTPHTPHTTKDSKMETTTYTFTYPSTFTHTREEVEQSTDYQLMQEVYKQYSASNINSRYATALNMDNAIVDLTPHHITKRDYKFQDETVTTTFVIGRKWAVYAAAPNGNVFVAKGRGSHVTYTFDTKAEATKYMKKLTRSAAEWNFQEMLRNKNAELAVQALKANVDDTPTGDQIDPDNFLNAQVRIHQMGKFRVGVIVGQTPTKWVVIYTTPSNPTEIRTTKINKKG